MESQRLGETQGFPPITGSPLTVRVMPALDRYRVSGAKCRVTGTQ